MNVYYLVTLSHGSVDEFRNSGDRSKFSYEIHPSGALIIHDNEIDSVYAHGEWKYLNTYEDTKAEDPEMFDVPDLNAALRA